MRTDIDKPLPTTGHDLSIMTEVSFKKKEKEKKEKKRCSHKSCFCSAVIADSSLKEDLSCGYILLVLRHKLFFCHVLVPLICLFVFRTMTHRQFKVTLSVHLEEDTAEPHPNSCLPLALFHSNPEPHRDEGNFIGGCQLL